MKKIIVTVVAMLSILSNRGIAQAVKKGPRPTQNFDLLPDNAYNKNKLLIKLTPDAHQQVTAAAKQAKFFGIPELDAFCSAAKVISLQKFNENKSSQSAFAQRHEAWGFHLWYVLETADTGQTKKHLAQLSQLKKWVAIAEPELKITQDAWTPDDPRYIDQWHYNNTGTLTGTADADIDLPEAWELEKGKPNILVSIVDGGIDTNHLDLKQNLWTSSTERFGYNFIDDTEGVYGHSHGTHVAGTVGAVSNNGIGVSGVAGGNGSDTTGIRMISSQVFGSTTAGTPGFVNAIIYGADRGAAISQNSWGHNAAIYYNTAYLDAIDYFIAYGGGDLYDQGLVVFSAGNDNHDLPKYPGHYERVIRVAATNNKDTRSYYSCFGTSVDISAPGGETNALAARGVLSTNIGNTYLYNQGTSMASPHVSGVAALVASMAQDRLSMDDIRSIVINEVDNIDALNTAYIGKLGKGRLNALKALQKTDSLLSLPEVIAPAAFAASQSSCGNFNLSWSNNADGDEVMIAVATTRKGLFGIPKGSYSVGDTITGGGVIIYKGAATTVDYSFSDSTRHFIGFKAWSINEDGNYSKGLFDFENYTPCATLTGNIKYVKQGATGSGTSWVDASGDLQAMINSAQAGDSIFVAAGTYKPIRKQYDIYTISSGNRFNSFVLKNGITILGGFPEDDNTADISDRDYNLFETILSGDLGIEGVSSDNSYNVVFSYDDTDSTTIFDGFTITDGNANITTNNIGGGWKNYGNCKASNLIFINNRATFGAAIYNNGTVTLDSVTIQDNIAATSGGAIYATGSTNVSNALITGNEANYGGAIYNDHSNLNFSKVVFHSNNAVYSGGAWYNKSEHSIITNTLFTQNSATSGGALYNESGSPTLSNTTISDNSTYSYASGSFHRGTGSPKIVNSIIWENYAYNEIYENTYNVNDASMIYTIKGGHIWYGEDSTISIGTAPVLSLEDFSLLPCSPAINRGINDSVVASTDLAANTRIINTQVDLGVYEKNSLELNEIADSTLIADDDCSTGNWLHFFNTSPDKIIVSINTNGQDLGTITAKSILNNNYGTGNITILEDAFGSSDSYYPFNRSWAISSTIAPTAPVNVRFYFSATDSADIAANITLGSIADLLLYKVDGEDAWNTAATGHTGYTNGTAPSTTQYQLGSYQGIRYAEFQVNEFSAGSMALTSSTPLPIELLSFNGSNVNNQKTLLQWKTVQEENIDQFEIEKSRDGINWTYLTTIKATQKAAYQDWDNQPFEGINLYRLKMIEHNGSYKYSPTVKVIFERSQMITVNVYPNPNDGKFILTLSNAPATEATLKLTDITGRLLYQSGIKAVKTELNVPNIAAGVYNLQLITDGNMIHHKIVIQ